MTARIEAKAARAMAAAFGSLSPTTTRTAISSVSARTTLSRGGIYRVISDVQCWLKQMSTNEVGDVATSEDAYLPADQEIILAAHEDQGERAPRIYLNAICAAGVSGYLYVTELLPGQETVAGRAG